MSSIQLPDELFLADEGVDFRIIATLRRLGYQVQAVAEECPGIADIEVLSLAVERNAVLITEDKDFGEMLFHKRLCSQGVLFLRLQGVPTTRRVELVSAAFLDHAGELRGCFSVITERALRIRQLTDT